jgi:putative flippase GtrA
MVFLRFITSGLANSLLGLVIIYLAKFAGGGDIVANATGYAVGFLLSFVVNKKWTFKSDSSTMIALIRFAIVMAAAYLANLCTVITLIEVLKIDGFIAQACGIPVYAIIGFLGCRFFAFSHKNIKAETW